MWTFYLSILSENISNFIKYYFIHLIVYNDLMKARLAKVKKVNCKNDTISYNWALNWKLIDIIKMKQGREKYTNVLYSGFLFQEMFHSFMWKNNHINMFFWKIFRHFWNRAIIQTLWNWIVYKNTFYSFNSMITTMFQSWIENLPMTHGIWQRIFQEVHKISRCSVSMLPTLPTILIYEMKYFNKHLTVV